MEADSTTAGGMAPADGSLVVEGFVDVVAIASGGDSTIYRAHQPSLDRDVAIKVVNLSDPDDLRRFNREIALTVRLGRAHPNIVTVLDTRTLPDGRPCIVMDLFELGSTHDRLRSTGPFGAEEVVTIGRVIGDALAFAHAQRVMHRDVKPQNILIMPTSYVLADFGIARLIDAGHTASLERLSYRHASPEVLDGQAPEPSDDLWSLCSTMATLVEGRAPFAADDPDDDTALAYLRRVRTAQRRPLPADIPPSLARIIDRGMDPDRSRRYQRAEDLIADLRALEREFISWAPSSTPEATSSTPGATAGTAGPAEAGGNVGPDTAADLPGSTAAERDDSPTAPRAMARPGPTDLPADSEDRWWAPGAMAPAPAPSPDAVRSGPGQPVTGQPHGNRHDAGAPEPRGGTEPPGTTQLPGGAEPPGGTQPPGDSAAARTGAHSRPTSSSDAVAPALSVAALIPGNGGRPDDRHPVPAGNAADAAPTGLRSPEPAAPVPDDQGADDAPKTPPKVRAGIIVLAVALLLGSAVLAYFLAKPDDSQQVRQQPGGITQIDGVGGPAGSGAGGGSGAAGSGGVPSTVQGADLSDPDYIPEVLSVAFKNGFVTLVVANPKAEDVRFVVFDVTDQDERTHQGPSQALNTDYLLPADGPNSSLTVRFPTERCGQVVRFSVMAMNPSLTRKGVGESKPQQSPAC